MPKSKQQKTEIVKRLSEGLKETKAAVFANFQGLTVAQADELRRACRKEGASVLVAKKTLLKRVFEGLKHDVDPSAFEGGVATVYGSDDEMAPAKIVHGLSKKMEPLKIFGGLFGGKFVDAEYVKGLAVLPSKKELLGQLVGSLNAPLSGLANVLAGNLRGLVSVLNNIKEAKV